MSSRKSFEIFVYKNKLNTKTLIDILPQLSSKTIEFINKDLNINTDVSDFYIFSDGGCRSNGKKNAKAGYSVFFTDDQDSPFYNFNTTRLVVTDPTNNKAELSGIKCIFKTINENLDLFKNRNIIICTDSMYSINCLEKWYKSWIKNNWKNSKGEDVKNQDLIKQILEYKTNIDKNDIKTKLKHVFSHIREPSDKTSLQWKLFNGNRIVDVNINKILDLEC
jgi:ribonuclease HI